jgi:hypothetical protein
MRTIKDSLYWTSHLDKQGRERWSINMFPIPVLWLPPLGSASSR